MLDLVKPIVPNDMISMLVALFCREEAEMALFQMHPNKAPDPDGMNALFYKTLWSTIGEEIIDKVLNFLNDVENVGYVDQTHIVLIPQKKHLKSPIDFRPISLYNVVYKLVSKELANRTKKSSLWTMVIRDSKSDFVPGRFITDIVLVAYECFHFLRKKRREERLPGFET